MTAATVDPCAPGPIRKTAPSNSSSIDQVVNDRRVLFVTGDRRTGSGIGLWPELTCVGTSIGSEHQPSAQIKRWRPDIAYEEAFRADVD
jgi:hypothetical protein